MNLCGTFTILQPTVRLIDPHINTDDKPTLCILTHVFEPLVRFDCHGEYEGALCDTWTVSNDSCQWTFHLRHPVLFHNGDILEAIDVVESFKRIINPQMTGELGTQGVYEGYLGNATIYAEDKFTIKFITPEPMADLLDFLVKFPIVSHNTLSTSPEAMAGTGPFFIKKIESKQIDMISFQNYWGNQPEFNHVIWKEEPSSQKRMEALLSGNADLISALDHENAKVLESNPAFHLISKESSTCTVFMCNHAKGICMDRRIRQALNYGLDKEALIRDVMNNAAYPLNGPLTGLHFGNNPKTPVYPYDPQKAKELLSEAGYANGLELILDVPLVLPDEALALAKCMCEQYKRIGIKTMIKQFSDRPVYAAKVREKDIDDACCFDSSPLSTYQVFSDKFHSALHGVWWQGYKNMEFDALVDQARATSHTPARKEIYQKAYQILNEDAVWIFLHNPILMWGTNSRAVNVQITHEGLIRLQK